MKAAALPLLANIRNLAVGPAIAEALPYMDADTQNAAVDLLGELNHRQALATVVGRFLDYDAPLQTLLVNRRGSLFSGAPGAIGSGGFEQRRSAIEFIVASGSYRLAYLLADALKIRCPRTREFAADGLRRLAAAWLAQPIAQAQDVPPERSQSRARQEAGSQGMEKNRSVTLDTARQGQAVAAPFTGDDPAARGKQSRNVAQEADDITEALRKAAAAWELHYQPKALEAALWFADRLMPTLESRLRDARSRFLRAVLDLISGTRDPRMAPFLLQALTLPTVRPAASRAIARAHEPAMIEAVVRASWRQGVPQVERACRWIRESPWLHGGTSELLRLSDELVDAAVRLLMASGGPTERRLAVASELLGSDRAAFQSAIIWHSIEHPDELSTRLLSLAATRGLGELSTFAADEVRRREWGAGAGRAEATPSEAKPTDPVAAAFERLRGASDKLDDPLLESAWQLVRENAERTTELLRPHVTAFAASDRAIALQIASRLANLAAFELDVYHLCSDPDAIVRARAVSLLHNWSTPTSIRLLRAATGDPDPRVQANAVEALDRMDAPQRVEFTETKLASAHARVRANAIKSLLRVDLRAAGDALLDMLEDPDAGHRAGALWVIERLHLRTLVQRVADIERGDADARVRARAQRVMIALRAASESHKTKRPASLSQVAGGHR